MALTVDFINDIVALMTPTITIDSVVDNGDGTQTISVCNTYWIRKYKVLTIDAVEYTVSAFVKDTSFTVPSTTLVKCSFTSSFLLSKESKKNILKFISLSLPSDSS